MTERIKLEKQKFLYIEMPNAFPEEIRSKSQLKRMRTCYSRTMALEDVIGSHKDNPMVNLDFNEEGRLLGIEIIT